MSEAVNFLEGLDPSLPQFAYLGKDFDPTEAIEKGFSGWHTTADGAHDLAYQVIGDKEALKKPGTIVFMVHHGGPGDTITPSHIAPLLGLKNEGIAEEVVIFASNQPLSGLDLSASGGKNYQSKYNGDPSGDVLASYTPEATVRYLEEMRIGLLGGAAVFEFAGSHGSTIATFHGQVIGRAFRGAGTWGQTMGHEKEAGYRYDPDGLLAEARDEEYGVLVDAIPEEVFARQWRSATGEGDPLAILKYCNEKMNPTLPGYNEALARRLAVIIGLIHLSAAAPEVYGGMAETAREDPENLYATAEVLGMNPLWFAGSYVRHAVEYLPKLNRQLVRNMGKLAGRRYVVGIGSEDVLTPRFTTDEFITLAVGAKVDAKEVPIDQGLHGRDNVTMQRGLVEVRRRLLNHRGQPLNTA